MSFINRRDFVRSVAGAAAAPLVSSYLTAVSSAAALDEEQKGRIVLRPFDYTGVRLLDGMLKNQYQAARDYFFNLSNDDMLLGYRRRAGKPAPGNELPGWYGMDIGN